MAGNKIPNVPKINSLIESIPVDQLSAFSFLVQRIPVSMNDVHPTKMNNYENQTMATMLALSSKELPDLDFVLMSYWSVTFNETIGPGTHDSTKTVATTTTTTETAELKGSVSGVFDGGTWSGGGSTSVDHTSTITTTIVEKNGLIVPNDQNIRHLFWQWTTLAGFFERDKDPTVRGSVPFSFYDDYKEGHKNFAYQLGFGNWISYASSVETDEEWLPFTV